MPTKESLQKLKVEQLKPKAKRLGVKLTNPSGNAKTKAQLITAIIKAEAKKPVAKKTVAKKPAARKPKTSLIAPKGTNRSVRRDSKRQALPPGKRVSKTGRVYYERRANRADAGKQMLGEKYLGWENYWTWKWALEMVDDNLWREKIEEGYFGDQGALSRSLKMEAVQLIDDESMPSWVKSFMSSILTEIKWYDIAEHLAEGTDLEEK